MNQYPPPDQHGQYPPQGPPPGNYPPPGGYPPGNYPPPGGQPPPGGGQYWQESPQPKGMAITAMVLGIIGLLTFWTVLLTIVGVICGLLAAVLGLLALLKARSGKAGGPGMAVAGLIMGVISVIGGIVVGVLVWTVFKDTGTTDFLECVRKADGDSAKVDQCQREYNQRLEDKFSVTLTPVPTR
ncbi:DUF4190 domain-containing protein [Nocardia tengchongensis]|uniref:DUF4190 domain-containing protein n=1 Tax=Nocardia tengchongensis TaxID=2055889 RepID=UPI0036CCDFC1